MILRRRDVPAPLPVVDAPAAAADPLPIAAIEPRALDDRAADVEGAGRWYFQRDILERLDEYFRCVGHVRADDPFGYALISRVGAVVPNDLGEHLMGRIVWNARVSFGAALWDGSDNSGADRINPKFVYFLKMDRPPAAIEPWVGPVYETHVYLSEESSGRKKHGYHAVFYVGVSDDGTVRTLREWHVTVSHVRPRARAEKRRYRTMGDIAIPSARWGYPKFLRMIAEERNENRTDGRTNWTPAEMGAGTFSYAYNQFIEASADVRVAVTRGGVTATFAVDTLRIPQFFSDRDGAVLDASGRRAKIFHVVRTHSRVTATGRTSHVKLHYRGLREFRWHGYDVRITVPGRHHADLLRAEFGAVDVDHLGNRTRGWVDVKKMWRTIAEHMAA